MREPEIAAVFAVDRSVWLRRGIWLEYFTITWNVFEAAVAIAAGVLAGSIALVGFGLDSLIESASGFVLLWRLRHELQEGSPDGYEKAERKALLCVGVTFWGLAAYVAYEALGKLAHREVPEGSLVGIVLALVSLLVMPFLAYGKMRVAQRLGSRALQADAMQTVVCTYLSLTLLTGLALNAWVGWWWTDPLAALLMLPPLIREGWEAIAESTQRDETRERE